MQNGSHVPFNAQTDSTDCVFCQRSMIANILKETDHFLIAADHAPLVEGHLLIIPRQHYACYGAVPEALDGELFALKDEMRQFMAEYYAPVVFWEHGIFRQTVFHAHLHCFPFGKAEYNTETNLHGMVVSSQDDIRTWYETKGQYFYMQDARLALLFAPDMETYLHIIRDVLWHGASQHGGSKTWRSPQQRYEEGVPLVETTAAKWQLFQQQRKQQGASYADETSAR